ncbi:MAG: hypothetical protein NVSMB52_15750 [Chloroflexota bacterium]
MTLVSVVIPTRNRAGLVKEAIESVLAVQRDSFELEVIVVDDGSIDETPSVVEQYPVTYLRTCGGLGAPGARNAGIRAAHGDYIAFLDDDDVWLPTNVTPQLRLFAEHPEYGIVHAQVIISGPDGKTSGVPSPTGPLPSGWIYDDLLRYWPQSAATVVPRAVLQEVGIFDASLGGAEDWDLMLRIARRYPVGRVEQPVALFCQRDDHNEIQRYGRMIDMIKVFHRNVRDEPLLRRLLLRPIIWHHRNWFASHFLTFAELHAARGEHARALRGLRYALRASPPYTIIAAARVFRTFRHIFSSKSTKPVEKEGV